MQGPGARRAARILTGLFGLAYAGARWPGHAAVLDNLSNFPAHFAAAFLACALLLAWVRSPRWAIAAAAGFAFSLAQVLPWYAGAGISPSHRPSVKLLISNVKQGNVRYDLLERLVASENPDVIGLVEVNQRWQRALGFLRAQYPYRYELPDESFVGLGLYSRLPLRHARALRIPEGSTPAIAATLGLEGGDVEIMIVHPPPPMNAQLIQRRNEHILGLAHYARSAGGPLVIAGDFNVTMWNAGYRPLAEIGGLVNARQGRGIRATWPSLGPLGVPIDHIVATPQVQLEDFRVLPDVGSDHSPVSAMLSLRRIR
jgi:endonuclease/exonuclease/phosphatase (EEP) superfamily protein YafD